jgi:hypothetical protein
MGAQVGSKRAPYYNNAVSEEQGVAPAATTGRFNSASVPSVCIKTQSNTVTTNALTNQQLESRAKQT